MKESIHRIERAIVNSGFVLPANRVVINLAPAELPKQAASFDLPIALGLLAASGQLASELLDRYAVVGELALDGTMRPVKGALSMAMAAKAGGKVRGLIVPARQRRRSGGRRRRRRHPGQLAHRSRGVPRRAARRSSRRRAASPSCSKSSAATTKTSPTSAARRWPSGPS